MPSRKPRRHEYGYKFDGVWLAVFKVEREGERVRTYTTYCDIAWLPHLKRYVVTTVDGQRCRLTIPGVPAQLHVDRSRIGRWLADHRAEYKGEHLTGAYL